jgi:hypothetical protein
VDDTIVKTLTAEKDLNFSLFFSRFSRPGTYEVYAFSPGDSLFKPAKSNVVKITVIERFDLFFYLLPILVAIVSFFAGVYARALTGKNRAFREKILNPSLLILTNTYAHVLKLKKHGLEENKVEQENESSEKPGIVVANEEVGKGTNDEVPEVKKLEDFDMGDAYRRLFDATIIQYDLGKSLTPRELSEAITNKNEPFTGAFRDVTAIHERAFYGGMGPVDGEEERYFNEIGDILRYFKG